MKVLVTGSRFWPHKKMVWDVLDGIQYAGRPLLRPEQQSGEEFTLIQGGASGADTHALAWTHERNVQSVTVKAEWDKHGKAAGPIRNQQMVDMLTVGEDIVLAFIYNGSHGAAHCVRAARAAGFGHRGDLLRFDLSGPDVTATMEHFLHERYTALGF